MDNPASLPWWMYEMAEDAVQPEHKHSVFYVSDRTGITAETLGRSLLTQFEGVVARQARWPFLDTPDKAQEAVDRLNQIAEEEGERPIVFSTLIDSELRGIINQANAVIIDFFDTFNSRLEQELGVPASRVVGRSHGIHDYSAYTARIDSLNFALATDDGITTRNYPAADIILIGVSRSGKTPTCLYLALQYGVLAANYPITEEDLGNNRLPEVLQPYRDKLFGLTIDPERLHHIRSERRPNSRYASVDQCRYELDRVEGMYRAEAIHHLNTTSMSIEEIATSLLHAAGLERRLLS